ncbi:MliC family protein [Sphingomicrobium aestuariivivum]|uniref:MliC family protein n=1 Tax=Sphingomicrobium aestuariivivum TaxID=1582356 RepID=UPI001FD6B608|nr:MliC family protein [Sphingomicrobium aestuariivivum]MCJ8190569.1 MliC family protein [Sphingomicrobium aestuariivivum]
MKISFVAAVPLALLITACASDGDDGIYDSGVDAPDGRVYYICDNGRTLFVDFDGSTSVTVEERGRGTSEVEQLTREATASGARYVGPDGEIFWDNGDEAMWRGTSGEETTCQKQ